MPTRPTPLLPRALPIWFALAAVAYCAVPITVTDQKGRSIEIDLVSFADPSVTFRRQGDPKEFTLPLTNFDQASQVLIRQQAGQIPAAMPKIQPDVVIGKRRRDKDGSYYMVKQEITSTIKLANLSTTARVPPLSGKIVFIGQNSRTPDLLNVLSIQSFEVSIDPGETFIKEMEAFVTSYDSDNKGVGNVGGYQYFGFVLALMDPAGKVVLDHTTTGSFRLALANKPGLLQQVIQSPKGTTLTPKLEPSDGQVGE